MTAPPPDPLTGVGITTHNRRSVFLNSLAHWQRHLPAGAVLVVVDDGSDEPVPPLDGVTLIRHKRARGVAAAKNACIAALMDAGCDHLFLADDDMWPVNRNWAQPYVDDPEPHLMHCWGKRRLIQNDGHYTIWTHPRGVLLYVERRVIEAIGGMRLEYGRWGGEHAEWSRRIHTVGFTKHRYADLSVAQHGFWHCEDYARTTPSSVGQDERRAYKQRRGPLNERFRDTTDFVEYRTPAT